MLLPQEKANCRSKDFNIKEFAMNFSLKHMAVAMALFLAAASLSHAAGNTEMVKPVPEPMNPGEK
jgi:hypothetical protein